MEDTQYNNRRSRSRKRRRKRKSCVFFKTFITVFAIFSLFLIGSRVLTPWFSGELTTEQMDGVGDNFSSIPETVQPDTSIVPQMAEIDLENLYSPYAILVDLDSGTVLKEKNSTDRIYPASLTKIMDSTEVTGGEILGGKTGYTEEAGLCLASLAQVNGKEYILVTAKANGTHQTEQFHILDAINVYSQIGEAGQNTYE